MNALEKRRVPAMGYTPFRVTQKGLPHDLVQQPLFKKGNRTGT